MKFINNSEEEYRIVQAACAILQSKELKSVVQYCKKQKSCDTCVFFNECGLCYALNLDFFADKVEGKQEWIDECDAWLNKVGPKLRKKRQAAAQQKDPAKRNLSNIFKHQERRR